MRDFLLDLILHCVCDPIESRVTGFTAAITEDNWYLVVFFKTDAFSLNYSQKCFHTLVSEYLLAGLKRLHCLF